MIIVVGKGVGAFVYLQQLFQRKNVDKTQTRASEEVVLIHEPRRYPACSWSSTAMVFPYGIRAADSPWSRTLSDAYHAFGDFYAQAKPAGVEVLPHFIINPKKDIASDRAAREKFVRQWKVLPYAITAPWPGAHEISGCLEQGYHVDVQNFEKMMAQQISALQAQGCLRVIEEKVVTVNARDIRLADGQVLRPRQAFFANSYGAMEIEWQGEEFVEWREYLKHCRAVCGSYLEWRECPAWIKTPLALDLGGDHLIFRPDAGLTLMGSTTQDSAWAPDVATLEGMYRRWSEWLQAQGAVTLPALERAHVRVGMRLRGRKKRPWIGALSPALPHYQGLLATYKNGYSLPFSCVPAMINPRL